MPTIHNITSEDEPIPPDGWEHPLIHSALAAARRALPAVGKDSRNPEQGFNYRGIDAVIDAVGPVLADHGINPEVQYTLISLDNDHVTKSGMHWYKALVECKVRLIAEDGSFVTEQAIGMGLDMQDKAINKAMSLAYKYAVTHGLMLPGSKSDDADADIPEPHVDRVEPAPRASAETISYLEQWRAAMRTAKQTALSTQLRATAEELRGGVVLSQLDERTAQAMVLLFVKNRSALTAENADNADFALPGDPP